MSELHAVAHKMVEKGKGILAADESTPTCTKRFASINTDSTAESRNFYRNMLFTAKDIEKYISGVILFDETFHQSELSSGMKFPEYLTSKDILPGIKVDQGLEDFSPYEKLTKGLDGLSERLEKYYALGARFAKWRAVITPGDSIPTDDCILANAKNLAKYARKCQQANLVPIVEPEVLMDGSHTIDESFDITSRTLNMVFNQLDEHNVRLEGIVLKPNMVLSGYDCSYQATIKEVAEKTINCLFRNVPPDVPGIAFLSGGQSDDHATFHLNEMNKYETDWNLTFSYGRALQQAALKAWSGKKENVTDAQEVFIQKAKANSLATVAGL
ncbi:MAG: fructose-bisphosphate aldolase class I [Candidatus Marinimicrobia bacterium]|nr:fructose-bisphosphate aldolase class I [Candidatus Neomarinimicrobiota bacterium]MDA1363304.1 fructose-bisphosphate aldolase class I [Candidatus Neomarinimicrobiota bacterium]